MESPSCFLQEIVRRFNVPLAAREYFHRYHTIDEGYTAAIGALATFCDLANPSVEDLEYFKSRLEEQAEALIDKTAGSSKRAFGTAYAEYLNSLSTSAIILRMCNYNYALARDWYCVRDESDALTAVQEYLRSEMEHCTVLLEASLFGFGGSYGDSAENGETIVLDPGSPEADALFKSWGMN